MSTDKYLIRHLQPADYNKGFLELLQTLTEVNKDDFTYEDFCNQIDKRQQCNTHTIVIEETSTNKIVATGSLVVELKFIHGLSSVGHVEDVVVDKSKQRQGLGKMIVNELVNLSKQNSCYKTILDCSENNMYFYLKCQFVKKDVHMVMYQKN